MSKPEHARELLRRSLEHWRAGRFTHAEALAEVALAWDAGSDDAMEMLGNAAAQRGDHRRAAGLLAAAAAQSETPARLAALAHALTALDRQNEALAAFRRVVVLSPEDGGAANDLGVALARRGLVIDAEAAFRRAVVLRPDMVEARGNLATALRQLGRDAEAAMLDAPVANSVDPVAVAERRAELLSEQGRHGEAAALSRTVMRRRPYDVALRHRHADRLQVAGHLAEAEQELRQVIARRSDWPEAHADLGWVLRRQDRMDEAIALLHAARQRWPREPRVLNALAIALQNAGELEAALEVLDDAAALAPDDAEVQHNRATLLLRLGRFAEGWDLYEWRWQMAQGRSVRRGFSQELWRGQPATGRTILLHAEQGLGDTLQFLRYVPMVTATNARVVLEVPASLARLVAGVPGVAELVWSGEKLPAFDLYCPLLSLPRVFGTSMATIPAAPYLRADDRDVAAWRERLARHAGLRVGIVWAGRPEHRDDVRRSVPFAALRPLWELSGVAWFSLQVGPRAAGLATLHEPMVTDLEPLLGDFADTAAALSALDLVVTVDTAIAHLAGALGRPTWVMLAFAADWRWLHERDDTPWYPSMRLFRQTVPGAWDGVIARITEALPRHDGGGA